MDKKYIGHLENGINIDHIPRGNALFIIRILQLFHLNNQIGVGLNLPSNKIGYKDLIKIENYYLSNVEIEAISIFALGATLSTIKNFKVIEKKSLALPKVVTNLLVCPNIRCVSRSYKSKFIPFINKLSRVSVKCSYCEQDFLLEKDFNI